MQQVSGIVKTSGVMISAGGENSFYRSVQEVPEPLRQRLIETTNSENSGMIVIADKAGRERWTEVVSRREAPPPAQPEAEPVLAPPPRRQLAGLPWAAWAGILLFLAAGALIASVFRIFHR